MNLPMTASSDMTLNPALSSWVTSANAADADFPVQNLPYGRFRRAGSADAWRIGVAIGDQILDLKLAADVPGWADGLKDLLLPLASGELNDLMGQPAAARHQLRAALSAALLANSVYEAALAPCLLPQAEAEMSVPCRIGDYTDFYTGIHHATTVGKLFRPDEPLLPNYKWVPIGYHGRASSIIPSGQPFHRPQGQLKPPEAQLPFLGATKRLDYELELAIYVGPGNALGEPVSLAQAESHIFGLGLLNDWSARDVQAWEYQPLGPFGAKNFASTVSPWIVTLEALAPFRAAFERPAGDPAPLPYLASNANQASGALDIQLEVWLQTPRMREAGEPAIRLSQSNYRDAYWTVAQLITHHTITGCNLQPGDMLGSGTLSGPQPEQAGSLLELTNGGKQPITLPNGETRRFLEDGDTITLRAFCQREGARRIGLGHCSGTVLPVRATA